MAIPARPRPVLALVANDHEWSGRSIESLLAPKGYAVLQAHNGKQTLKRASSVGLDLIILDANLPDLAGVEVCRALRKRGHVTPDTPIVMTSATPWRRAARLEALAAGAWEVVSFPLDAEEFLAKLNTFVKAKFEADRARDECLIDPVTGLYNSRGLMKRAREISAEAYREEQALACVAFTADVPEERKVTDEEIDQNRSPAIDRLARVFRTAGRASDAYGRLTEEEFVAIAPATDATGAVRLAERVMRALEADEIGANGAVSLKLRSAYYAVPNFRIAHMQPGELVARAAQALRRTQRAS